MFCLSFQKNFMQGASSSTTISYMNKTRCNSIPVLLPPTQLQQRFAEAFKKLTAQKQKIIENVAYFDNLFNSLLQKAFKGELNFNHDYIEKFLESES